MASSTVSWADEMSTGYQTASADTEALATSSSERGTSVAASYLIPYKVSFVVLGVLGTLTNGLVLGGFWISDRSNLTSSRAYIINHTTLKPSALLLNLYCLD